MGVFSIDFSDFQPDKNGRKKEIEIETIGR